MLTLGAFSNNVTFTGNVTKGSRFGLYEGSYINSGGKGLKMIPGASDGYIQTSSYSYYL